MGWLTLLGVAGDLGLCGGGRMPKTLCGTFGGSWGPKRVFWPVAWKADKPWLVWRGNGSCDPGMFGHHDHGEVFVAFVGLGSPFLRRR